MSWIPALRTRLHVLLARRASEARMEEEFRFHLDMETAKHIRAGLSSDEARRAALLSFGVVAAVALLLLGISMLACYLSSRPVTTVNPVDALSAD